MRSLPHGGGLGACRRGIGRHRTGNISIADMQQIHRHACTRASGKSSGEAGERPKQASRRSAMRPFSKQAARRQAGPGLRGLAKFQITALASPIALWGGQNNNKNSVPRGSKQKAFRTGLKKSEAAGREQLRVWTSLQLCGIALSLCGRGRCS